MRRILKVERNHFTKKVLKCYKDVGLIVSLFKGTILMNENNFWQKMFFPHLPRDLLTDVLFVGILKIFGFGFVNRAK